MCSTLFIGNNTDYLTLDKPSNIFIYEVKTMSKTTQHVVPAPNGGWNVKKGGAERATKHFDTKAPAVQYATKISKNQGAELVIHNKDGRVSNPNSYGHDPHPPIDKVH